MKIDNSKLFLGLGIAGFVGSTVVAVMKADGVKPIFAKAKKELKQPPTKGSKSKTYVIGKAAIDISKEMAIPIGMAVLSAGCVCKAYNIVNAKHLAAVGTIDILDTSLKTYKNAVKEEVDESTLKKIEDRVIRKQATDQLEAVKRIDYRRPYDTEVFNRYFCKDLSCKFPEGGADTVLPFLKSRETYWNQILHGREHFGRPGVVWLNEIYEDLGFPKIPEGNTAGFISYHGEGYIDFGISGAYYANHDGVLDRYNCVADTNKIPRSDSGYMLCFNVDPYIVK